MLIEIEFSGDDSLNIDRTRFVCGTVDVVTGGNSGSAPPKRHLSVWRVCCALAEWQASERSEFPLNSGPWKGLNECLCAQKRCQEPGAIAVEAEWAKQLFGDARRLLELFEPATKKRPTVRIRDESLSQTEVRLSWNGRSESDLVERLRTLSAGRVSRRENNMFGSVASFEPEKSVRDRLLSRARRLVDVRGVPEVVQMIVGKATLYERNSALSRKLEDLRALFLAVEDELGRREFESAEFETPLCRLREIHYHCKEAREHARDLGVDLGPVLENLGRVQSCLAGLHDALRHNGDVEAERGRVELALQQLEDVSRVEDHLLSQLRQCQDRLRDYLQVEGTP